MLNFECTLRYTCHIGSHTVCAMYVLGLCCQPDCIIMYHGSDHHYVFFPIHLGLLTKQDGAMRKVNLRYARTHAPTETQADHPTRLSSSTSEHFYSSFISTCTSLVATANG